MLTWTWSPTLIRMKFFRILPEIWASTTWPLGRRTRNMVPGRTCVTVPVNSIGSSFAMRISGRNSPSAVTGGRRTVQKAPARVQAEFYSDWQQLPWGRDVPVSWSAGIFPRGSLRSAGSVRTLAA